MGSATDTLCVMSIDEITSNRKSVLAMHHFDSESVFVRQSFDVINSGLPFDSGMRMRRAPHSTSPLLRKVVSEFLTLHTNYMTESLQGLHLSTENIISLYTGIATEIVGQDNSELTWGRVVLLYALAKHMAHLCFKQPSPQIRTFVVHVGHFIELKTSLWIQQKGGWESIKVVFGDGERPLLSDYFRTIAGYVVKAFDYSHTIPSALLKF